MCFYLNHNILNEYVSSALVNLTNMKGVNENFHPLIIGILMSFKNSANDIF